MILVVPNGFEANFTVGFARGLAANGLPILVASCPDTHERLRTAGIACVNLFDSPQPGRSAVGKAASLLRYYLRLLGFLLRNRGGVVHFSGMFRNSRVWFEAPFFGCLFRLLSERYIYTVHNVLPHSKDHSRWFRLIYRLVYRFPHVLIAHTPLARRQLIEEFNIPPGKIVLSSIGLNEEMPDTPLNWQEARARLVLLSNRVGRQVPMAPSGQGRARCPDRAARLSESPGSLGQRALPNPVGTPRPTRQSITTSWSCASIAPDDELILFFGKVEPYKGLDTLLDAFDLLSRHQSRLIIAGAFSSPVYRQEMAARIAQSPRHGDIRLYEGHIPNDQVEVFFRSCDVLCMPYRNIYQSGLLFLAPRFGLPMVTTDVGSLRSFVEPDMGVVAETNDARGLAAALDRFFRERHRFTREAIVAHAQRYRWPAICRELLPIYG